MMFIVFIESTYILSVTLFVLVFQTYKLIQVYTFEALCAQKHLINLNGMTFLCAICVQQSVSDS